MWVFTKYGFFSAVCARQDDGGHRRPVDPDRIMVRARVREHLESLKTRFPDLPGGREIRKTASAEYAFRLFVAKPAWARVSAALAEETDYDNFKSAVALHQGATGTGYEHAARGLVGDVPVAAVASTRGEPHSVSGANPRRRVFSVMLRGTTNWSR